MRIGRFVRSGWMWMTAILAGFLEAYSIYVAVLGLGKQPLMPFIAWLFSLSPEAGLVAVVFLRLLLVTLAHAWKMHHVTLALTVWWAAWIPLNLDLL